MPDLTQLFMRCLSLDDLPAIPGLPDGYAIRSLLAGDEQALADMLAAAFPEHAWDLAAVQKDLLGPADVEKTYVAVHHGMVVGTATARYVPDWYPHSQYVHWVGVHPHHRGKDLGKWLTVRVMEHGREAGRRDAVLETDDFRIPAIKVYLSLSFVPECRSEGDAARWAMVADALGRALSPQG